MKIKADVTRATGATVHRRANLVDGALVPGEQLAVPARVEIEGARSGFFLFYYDVTGQCLTDTWHPTLDEAKAQAELEFGIGEDEWVKIAT